MKRWEVLDELRGLAVLCLFIFNGFYHFKNTPWWLTHNPNIGIWPADVVAPIFLFSVGMSSALSLQKRIAVHGRMNAIWHYVRRNLFLILFGVLGEIFYFQKIFLQLGVLGSIGMSSLIALPFLLMPWKMRPVYAGFLLIIWQMMQWLGYGVSPHSNGLGGIFASVAWAAIVVIASFMAEAPRRDDWQYTEVLLFTFAGTMFFEILTFHSIPITRPFVSASYILSSIEIVLMILLLLHFKNGWQWKFLSILGRNPLPLYMISGLIGCLASWLFDLSLPLHYLVPLAGAQVAASIGIALFLDKKQWYWRL